MENNFNYETGNKTVVDRKELTWFLSESFSLIFYVCNPNTWAPTDTYTPTCYFYVHPKTGSFFMKIFLKISEFFSKKKKKKVFKGATYFDF